VLLTTVTSSTIDSDRVLSCMCLRAIQGHFAALVAVVGVDRPCCLIPAVLEAFGHLREGRWRERERKRKESGLCVHG
jgi:hypothetical protein